MRAAILLLGLFAFALPRAASAGALPEEQVKAAFIFNFLLFTNWPESQGRPPPQLRLCTAGNDDLARALTDLNGNRLGATVVTVSPQPASAADRRCDALYLAASERSRWPAWLDAAGTHATLTITDSGESLNGMGGVLEVAVENDRVVFRVDLDEAQNRGLGFSSRVLQLARQVNAP